MRFVAVAVAYATFAGSRSTSEEESRRRGIGERQAGEEEAEDRAGGR